MQARFAFVAAWLGVVLLALFLADATGWGP